MKPVLSHLRLASTLFCTIPSHYFVPISSYSTVRYNSFLHDTFHLIYISLFIHLLLLSICYYYYFITCFKIKNLQIGVILRDSNGVPSVRSVTGNKILRILKKNGLAATIPEDLYCLIKKAVSVRKHLERNKKDKDSKFRLILVESRIHRLSRYYRTVRKLDANWKYESTTASTLVA